MPELPEVETVVRSLAPLITGRRIENVELTQPRIVTGDPEATARALSGRTIESVTRHGKFIAISLRPAGFLIVHLGMTGKLLWNGEPNKHTHAIFTTDAGTLLYEDIRQFGRVEYSPDLPPRLAALGPDALAISLPAFFAALRLKTTRIKSVLLNQAVLRGLGNIYVDEALFRAGIHPLARGSRLTRARIAKLYEAMREVLLEAIEQRGSSISDYVDADGNRGSFQDRHRVYQRTGQPCVTCTRPIRRILVTQRGTHFCPACQKR